LPRRARVEGAATRGVAPVPRARIAAAYGAGRGLYATEPVFRDAIDACAERLGARSARPQDLLGYGDNAAPTAEVASQLRRTAHAQPALFAVGYATARLLMSWGVSPAAMLRPLARRDHRGDASPACSRLDDALVLVAARARLMHTVRARGHGGALRAFRR
jgi:acyl transferase domain-containing protein